MTRVVIAILVALTPQVAFAHLVSARFGDFYSGLLHPLTTLVHLLPWLGLAMVTGSQSLVVIRRSLAVFPAAVMLGGLLGDWLHWPNVLDMLLVATFFPGILAILGVRLSMSACSGLWLCVGLVHGAANLAEQLDVGATLRYSLGAGLAAYLVMVMASTSVYLVLDRLHWGWIAVRALASWLVAVGVLFAGFLALMGGVA